MYLQNFIDQIINHYNKEEITLIKRCLEYASKKHDGQFRKSGEPFIIHPIAVANKLIDLKADVDTICAALLHDVLEDTDTKKEELIQEFNLDIANLVDGVTKFKDDVLNLNERKAKYIRKLTTSILKDVRIIIIKLMDRLHNMETLMFQKHDKQIKIANETLEVFVPIAYYLGMYEIRFLLEDLAFKYLNSYKYNELEEVRNKIFNEGETTLDEMINLINKEALKYNIKCEFEKKSKNIYGIYKRIQNGSSIFEISDILRIKIICDNVNQCYQILGIVHYLFHPINGKIKDYISNPKSNMYQSLHTTVFTSSNQLIQLQIRTKEMNDVNRFGIVNEWINGNNDKDLTNYLIMNYPFINVLREINDKYKDDILFLDKLEHDVLKEKVYIIIGNGNREELPIGSTVEDLCNKYGIDYNLIMVNGDKVDVDYVFKSNDYISFERIRVKKK